MTGPLLYVSPSKANAGNVGLSFASTLIPGVTGGSAAVKVIKGTGKATNACNSSTAPVI